MYRRKRRRIRWLCFGALLLLLFFIGQGDTGNVAAFDGGNSEQTVQAEEEATLSREQIVALTDKFMDILVQQTDAHYKVINYQSKQELLEAFAPIAAKEAAAPYVDYYYHDEADGLHMIPTETPPWFNKENDYDMVKIDENKVQVEQENESAVHGKYKVIYEFTADEQQDWKITRITHE